MKGARLFSGTALALFMLGGACIAGEAIATSEMRSDVAKLLEAAKKRTMLWPWKPAEPEVAVVAAHGRAVAPLLVAELAEDPDHTDGVDWNVQQQVALALCTIYGVSEEGGHVYMSRASPDLNARVKAFWVHKVIGK